ncbi:hypothetical protein [Brevundimonas sp.]|uniref:hypothetical protein n=1 Tax=Brevundimonas sp. TaxID=1871086 RepID=UPI0025F90E96|nr:hypothetical protein [Brevundimonas sp.]
MRHLALIAAAVSLCACAPVVQGGPPIPLSPELVSTARIDLITMSSGWLQSEEDFSDTFTDEVREELTRCATGSRPLNLRLHVDDLERAGRLEGLVGGGRHFLAATAEFTDPARDDLVVGRFPITVEAPTSGGLAGVLADRQMVVSEAWARELCMEAFGRNPRTPGPHNATPN